ncbi:MAG: hypothetical protein ACO31I_05945 [Prochlorotrichaceae cyanobacterium]
MSNNHIIDEIQELLPLHAQDLHVSSIVFGDLEEPKYNSYSDCNFIESFQGHYILFKYLKNYNSNFDCKIFPRKGSIRKIISSKILNFIYQYEKDLDILAEVNDFRILSAATFRTGTYVGDKLKLTLDCKGNLKLLKSDRNAINNQSQKTSHNIANPQTVLQVEDTFSSSNVTNKPINKDKIKQFEEDNKKKDREIARLQERLNYLSSLNASTREISQLEKEVQNLREALCQIINLAQPLSLGFSVTEESSVKNSEEIDDSQENYYSEEPLQQNQEDILNYSSSDHFVDDQHPSLESLDSQTIKILNWYQQYQNNPDFLEQHTQKVSEMDDSFNVRRAKANATIVLAPASNHSFLIYGDQYMFPRPDSKITSLKLNTFEACFECENFSSGASFEVLKPAIVSKLSAGDDRWQLQERGQIIFY